MATVEPESLRPFKNGWVAPSGPVIKAVLQEARLSGRKAADLVGITDDRTVRRWTSGETTIPYAAWAILCAAAGHGQIWWPVELKSYT